MKSSLGEEQRESLWVEQPCKEGALVFQELEAALRYRGVLEEPCKVRRLEREAGAVSQALDHIKDFGP